jgi:hypothetical protein
MHTLLFRVGSLFHQYLGSCHNNASSTNLPLAETAQKLCSLVLGRVKDNNLFGKFASTTARTANSARHFRVLLLNPRNFCCFNRFLFSVL